jgi:(p)ppGpp synthase/HD superfamily hydrolase
LIDFKKLKIKNKVMKNYTYTDKTYKEARMVAVKAHSNQSYDEIFPYEKHLDDVVDVLKRFGFSGKYIVGGYLHDVFEDTGISMNRVRAYFGDVVFKMICSVTDEFGENRKEKKEKTLPKTASNPDGIILKLADRIANIEHGGKVDMYLKEYDEFKGALYLNTPSDGKRMWEHLDSLLGINKLETV